MSFNLKDVALSYQCNIIHQMIAQRFMVLSHCIRHYISHYAFAKKNPETITKQNTKQNNKQTNKQTNKQKQKQNFKGVVFFCLSLTHIWCTYISRVAGYRFLLICLNSMTHG